MLNKKLLLTVIVILLAILGYVTISANHASNEETRKATQDAFHKQLVDNTQNMGLHDGAGF
ncbi:hypothetical protein [Commensalibacter nepenthis]|uniref:Uncharacterized protein n=1 Tax=Commensalibacter nepenthis TaxID=3043872 RepID=A0ABT6QAF1_9PROT|nr:hypothetical protein [Commensalibacter sp. TBRC 10068]MDI2113888.1 hypothetical protein [Commensalibacter sp. TBRC 10068]